MKTAITLIPILACLSFAANAQSKAIITSPAYDNVNDEKWLKRSAKYALLADEPETSRPSYPVYFDRYNNKMEPHPRNVVLKPLHLKNYTSNFVR
ncbi:MAG: hypothetical protein K0Q79_973 [Flavipsychrobacter sp.]|nr:hypothetical protein [Flavipsychrobacter sp.]